jgi:hypothetical protein
MEEGDGGSSMANAVILIVLPSADLGQPSLKTAASTNSASRCSGSANYVV